MFFSKTLKLKKKFWTVNKINEDDLQKREAGDKNCSSKTRNTAKKIQEIVKVHQVAIAIAAAAIVQNDLHRFAQF